jgi:hypothetical protein
VITDKNINKNILLAGFVVNGSGGFLLLVVPLKR